MLDKKLLIRLFLTVVYLIILYNFTKNTMVSLADDVQYTPVDKTCVYDNNPPVGVANVIKVEKQVKKTSNKKSMGRFKLTGYCACMYCCGKTDGITSTGTKAKAGRTIAVDPSVIPYGSVVIINDKEYVAEDCGGAIKNNKIDVFFDTHEDALEWGVKYAEVFIKVGD